MKEMSVLRKVEIFIPFMDVETHKLDEAIKELCSLSGKFQIRFENKVFSSLRIEKVNKTSVEIKSTFNSKRRKYVKYFLKFSSEYSLINKSFIKDFMSFDYFAERYVRHFLIYSNVAIPGAFDTREGVIISKTIVGLAVEIEKKPFEMLATSLWDSLFIAEKYKWPKIQKLSILETLEFLQNHWSAFENLPVNRLQRALNAFSYLFHDNLGSNNHIDLFYSLIGIEALYVDGHDNVQKQVDKKSQILLGTRGEFKKVFGELYDFRSRYIHGQLNFLNKYYVNDLGEEVGNHQSKAYDNASFAMALLIASIQKQIQLKKSELEFDIILKE
jgi:hypothetical protein